jgi:hypothetical protein
VSVNVRRVTVDHLTLPPVAGLERLKAFYHPGYYAAFVLDPDANDVEAVHHGRAA